MSTTKDSDLFDSIEHGALRIIPLDTDDAEACLRWQSCQLCIYADNRLPGARSGFELSEDQRRDLTERALGRGERLVEVERVDWVQCFWVYREGRRAGIVSVERPLPGIQPFLMVYDLYIAPAYRGTGLGFGVLTALRQAAEERGFAGITLHTEWCWSRPLRYFLSRGFWASNWKRYLSLVLLSRLPEYEIRESDDELSFWIRDADGSNVRLFFAARRGEWLDWDETDEAQALVTDPARFYQWHYGRCTFAVHLALRGWPMVRDPKSWRERLRWSDSGMPEGLADKILVFQQVEREKGFDCGRHLELPGEIASGLDEGDIWPG